jgi:adenosine deaminase
MTIPQTLARRIETMPKVEIHVHLEGAADAETIYELAARNDVALPAASLEEWRQFYAFRDFDHFLEVYRAAAKTVQTLEDWTFIVDRFLCKQAEQNVRYCEAFISASLHLNKFPIDEWLDALAEGAAAGEKKYGCRIRLIADISREKTDSRHQVLDVVMQGRTAGLVIGLGLGGPEVGYPPEWFTDVYAEARRQGLRVVAHAGETVGPESIRGAITALNVERIGHGIRCLEDDSLVRELQASQTPLEISPTSNYCLGIVPGSSAHPIRQMVDAGLYCTVNSDDPAMFSTDLSSEYKLLAAQGFSWDELWQLNLNTLEATFLDEVEKASLREEWLAFASVL